MFCMKFLIHYAYSDMKLHMRCSNENHLSRLYDLWVCACKRYYLKTCIPGHAPELPTHPDGPNSTKGVLNSHLCACKFGWKLWNLIEPCEPWSDWGPCFFWKLVDRNCAKLSQRHTLYPCQEFQGQVWRNTLEQTVTASSHRIFWCVCWQHTTASSVR